MTFIPRRPPNELVQRNIKISAASGSASTLLILQAILPYLIFTGNDSGEPIELEISGGTNISFSLSYEYLDQVLLPALEEHFGILVQRRLMQRGWNLGPQSRGLLWLKFQPLDPSQKLQFKTPVQRTYPESYEVEKVDISIVVPSAAHGKLQAALVKDLGDLYHGADVEFKVIEGSDSYSRWYILLVAHSLSGIRWGRDWLGSMPKKTKNMDTFIKQVSNKLCRSLYEEVSVGGQADIHLQDQMVCFQALCEGYSSFPRGEDPEDSSPGVLIDAMKILDLGEGRLRKEKNHEPFGHGSLHTKTSRWVVSEMLPATKFYNNGHLGKGVGFSVRLTANCGINK